MNVLDLLPRHSHVWVDLACSPAGVWPFLHEVLGCVGQPTLHPIASRAVFGQQLARRS